jgi:hypothetical protein
MSRTIMLILFFCTSLACSFLSLGKETAPAPNLETSQTSEKVISYQNGVEVEVLPNGILTIIDKQGNYGLALPNQWEAGAVSMEFAPFVAVATNTNPSIGHIFESLINKENTARIFAFDTSPEHLNKDVFSILTVSMSQDKSCTNLSVIEIGNAAVKNELEENPYTEVTVTKEGESKYQVPWYWYETSIKPPDVQAAYAGFIVANTGETCIKINYATNNSAIKIEDELSLTIDNLVSITK